MARNRHEGITKIQLEETGCVDVEMLSSDSGQGPVAGVKTMALGLQVVYDETYSSTILATTGFSKGTLSTIVICYVTYLFSE